MCKNHDQLHYPAALREVASIAANGDAKHRDAILTAATYSGLRAIMYAEVLPKDPHGTARMASRLAAFHAASDESRKAFRNWLRSLGWDPDDEVPF
jgi:hypothetical protein